MANRSLNCGYIGQNSLIDRVAPFTSIQLNSRFNQISCPSLASPTKTRTVCAALCDLSPQLNETIHPIQTLAKCRYLSPDTQSPACWRNELGRLDLSLRKVKWVKRK